MATAFSSSESAALEREIELKSTELTAENVWSESQKTSSAGWVNKNKFTKVCLQFPDDQLTFSTKISEDLKAACPDAQFFILADTSYGSCCVDEIAAAHIQADSVIHFGNACQSRISRLPVFYIFPNYAFDTEKFVNCVASIRPNENNAQTVAITIFFESGYHHIIADEEAENELREKLQTSVGGREIVLERYPSAPIAGISQPATERGDCVFVGRDDQSFFNLSMSIKALQWYLYDANSGTLTKSDPMTSQWIRRRYFYIAKCKEAHVLGLIVATLTADGYLEVVKRIQEMARARGKRTYIISVGRINPAKLANFMEIDCFVLIGCPYNNSFTSRDFHKPIVSVFEAEMALNPAWKDKYPELYSVDFKDILPDGRQYHEFRPEDIEENDVSLVSGEMMRGRPSDDAVVTNGTVSEALTERKNFQLMETNGGANFEDRSWRGLEQALGRTEPAKITKGLSGIPTNYK